MADLGGLGPEQIRRLNDAIRNLIAAFERAGSLSGESVARLHDWLGKQEREAIERQVTESGSVLDGMSDAEIWAELRRSAQAKHQAKNDDERTGG